MYAPDGVGGVSASSAAFTFEDVLASIETAEPAGLHAAIASLVDRVIVHGDRVEPVFHAG
jgi:hypothetical protein